MNKPYRTPGNPAVTSTSPATPQKETQVAGAMEQAGQVSVDTSPDHAPVLPYPPVDTTHKPYKLKP